MSELRDILHERHATMAASLRDADEFDATAATRTVRSRRRGRVIVVGSSSLAVVSVLAAGTWLALGPGEPAIVPAGSPTSTPAASSTPTPTPSPSVSASPDSIMYEGRNPDMTDEEALYRAAHPATGEVWLDEPVEVEPPADFEWNSWHAWYHIGDRGDVRIYRAVADVSRGQTVFEQGPDGELSRVLAPRPSDPIIENPTDYDYPGARTSDVYYDSLALPASWTTPEGLSVALGGDAPGIYDHGGEHIDTLGQTEVWRYLGRGATYSGEDSGVTVHTLAYYLADPAGGLYTVASPDPLGTSAHSIEFTVAGVGNVDQEYVELTDQACSGTADYMAVAYGAPDAWWTPVGSTPTAQVFAPTQDNSIATTLYTLWDESFAISPGSVSLSEYLDAPAILATPAPVGDLWFLELGEEFSVRAWC